MATLLTQTQWHGNPRPITSYVSGVHDGVVASPYYKDGRGVPVNIHINSSVPLGTLAPAASILVPGPDLVVVGDLDGLWAQFTVLQVGITVTGGTNIVDTIVQSAATTLTAEDAAVRVSNYLNSTYGTEITAGHTGDGNVTISALSPVTALTITTWAVA